MEKQSIRTIFFGNKPVHIFLILFFIIGIQSPLFAEFTGIKNENLFSFRIIQDNIPVQPINNVYSIKSKPFYFEFTMKPNQTVYLNASYKLYTAAEEEKDFTTILGFGGTGMAENRRNKDTWLFPNDYGWHVWYFITEYENRFIQTAEKPDGTVVCLRYVDSIKEGAQNTDIRLLGNTTFNIVYCLTERVNATSYTYTVKEYNNIQLQIKAIEHIF